MKRSRSDANAMNTNTNTNTLSSNARFTRARVANAQSLIDDLSRVGRSNGYDIVGAIVDELQFQNQNQIKSMSLAALLSEIRRRVINGRSSAPMRNESIVQAFVHMMASSKTCVDGLLDAIRRRVLMQYPTRLGQPLPRWALANVAQSRG